MRTRVDRLEADIGSSLWEKGGFPYRPIQQSASVDACCLDLEVLCNTKRTNKSTALLLMVKLHNTVGIMQHQYLSRSLRIKEQKDRKKGTKMADIWYNLQDQKPGINIGG